MSKLLEILNSETPIWAIQLLNIEQYRHYAEISGKDNSIIIHFDRYYHHHPFWVDDFLLYGNTPWGIRDYDYILGISGRQIIKVGFAKKIRFSDKRYGEIEILWLEKLPYIDLPFDLLDENIFIQRVPKRILKLLLFDVASDLRKQMSSDASKTTRNQPENRPTNSAPPFRFFSLANLIKTIFKIKLKIPSPNATKKESNVENNINEIFENVKSPESGAPDNSNKEQLTFNTETGEFEISKNKYGDAELSINSIAKDGFAGSDEIKQIEKSPKKDPGGDIALFYGTTRNKTGNTNFNKFYGENFEENGEVLLKTGKCVVAIPRGHRQGDIERPAKILCWQFNENIEEHVAIKSIFELEQSDFYGWLRKEVDNSESRSVLIFIHGFNTTFAEAAWRTAQITHDIPFNKNISGFFSWPSTGGAIDYGRDIERADTTIPAFIEFVENIVYRLKIEHIHFIAHSMGNRILTQALNRLAEKDSFKSKIKTINQIILAAPDIDKDLFKTAILPEFKNIGKRRTLYASDKDEALKLSRKLRTGLARIGEAGDQIYVANGIDTIDASNIMSEGNHHSYIFETKELLTDLFLLLTDGSEPVKRRLREVNKKDLKYWIFPE